jgi:DNA transformation protein
MTINEDYLEYVLDNLAEFGEVRSKKMFGGVGLYFGGVMFGLIAQDTLYFKVDDSNRKDYESLGYKSFKPFDDKKMMMPYYEVPIDVLDDPDELSRWAEKAYRVAEKEKKKNSKKK